MSMSDKEAKHWGGVARGWSDKGYANELLGEQKRKTYIDLITRWTKITAGQKILKTDLFAEAFSVEQFLFDAIPAKSDVIGIDVALEIVAEAKSQALKRGMDAGNYLCSDVKKLPLRDNSVDLIISDSTLDHFPTEAEIITALKELGRVLADGGTLILTIDNKSNITYPPYCITRLWMKLGLSPYFIGRTLSLPRLKRTLTEIGLNIEENTAHSPLPPPRRAGKVAGALSAQIKPGPAGLRHQEMAGLPQPAGGEQNQIPHRTLPCH